jgi:uncharacterized membrane protein
MIEKANISEHVIKLSNLLICGLVSILFLFLSIAAIVSTSIIDPQNVSKEHILYSYDNIFINILVIAVFIILLKLLTRYAEYINPKIASIVLIAFTTIVGIIWAISVKSVPAADSGTIVKSARAFISGDYSLLQSWEAEYLKYCGLLWAFRNHKEKFGIKN